jgi:hypothetical protein
MDEADQSQKSIALRVSPASTEFYLHEITHCFIVSSKRRKKKQLQDFSVEHCLAFIAYQLQLLSKTS